MEESERLMELEERLIASAGGVEEIDALNALAWELREQETDRAQSLAERALNLSQPQKTDGQPYPQGSALALLTLGELANNLNAYGLALTRLLEAYSLLQDLPSLELLADTSHTIGWTHFQLGNYAESLDFLHQALKIFQDLRNQEKEASVLTSIGTVYSVQSNPSQAMETFQRALMLQECQEASRARSVTLNNLAIIQTRLGAIDEALANVQASLQITRELGLPSLEATVLDTLGQVYIANGDTHQAENILQQCLVISQRIGNEHIEMEAMLNLGKVYHQQGRIAQACEHFIQAVNLADGRRNNMYRYKYHEMLAKIYEEQGDLKNALWHYQEFHIAMELALGESSDYRLENLKILHQVDKARKEAEILWLQNRALEREIDDRRREYAEIEKLATTDPLTGLYNRRHFFTLGEYELEKARHTGDPLSVIILDIDHFKRVNDNFSHLVGDQALMLLAKSVSEHARKGDICCRYGGDEYVILLPNTTIANAQDVAERIRLALISAPIFITSYPITITASLGIVQFDPEDAGLEALLTRVDQALYRAKSGGRNRVSI